jgi:hypothetical protein
MLCVARPRVPCLVPRRISSRCTFCVARRPVHALDNREATAVSATLPSPRCEPDDDGGVSHKSVCLVAGAEEKGDERRMSSIIRYGDTYHGISVFGRGVLTNEDGFTYAGQHRDGYACGLSVLTSLYDGTKVYAEHGPDGWCDGRCLVRFTSGDTGYRLYERGGKEKDSAGVHADGRCMYNGEDCAPDDPRLLALIAQVAPVEVRPADRAPPPATRHPTRPRAIVRRIGRLVLHLQSLAAAVATEVHPNAARRRWWLRDTTQQQPHCKAQATVVTREAPSCTLTTAAWCAPMGPSRQRRCHATVQHAAC